MLRAARALLDLTQPDASKMCCVAVRTLVAAERGEGSLGTLHKLMGGYMGAGINFGGTGDYKEQSVTLVLREAPEVPPIPTA